LELLLNSAGYEFKSFENADSFLAIFSKSTKDIIILDLNLPGTHGCELISILKNQHISVPIIVITAASELMDKDQNRENNVKAIMKKPVDSEVLLHIIYDTLKNVG
jgi:DNA-binding response OmpR family regulator